MQFTMHIMKSGVDYFTKIDSHTLATLCNYMIMNIYNPDKFILQEEDILT